MKLFVCLRAPLLGVLALCCFALPVGAAQALDVRLLLDISDSMDSSDPDGLRYDAVAALIDLLPDGSKAGIWSFGQEVNHLVAHGTVDELWRVQAKARARSLRAVALYSALDKAIASATWDGATAATDRHLILLTDGALEIARDAASNEAAEARLLNETLPRLAGQGFRVHSLGLGSAANDALLLELARQSDGGHLPVASADVLDEAATELFAAIGGRDELPLQSGTAAGAVAGSVAGGEAASSAVPLAGEYFQVDAGIHSLTLIAFKPAAQRLELVDPAGQRFDRERLPEGSRWHVAREHEVVTLEAPVAGRWQVRGVASTRVFVEGDLWLSLSNAPVTLAPAKLHTLKVVLMDRLSGRPVAPSFARLLDWEAFIEADGRGPRATVELAEDDSIEVLIADIDDVEAGVLIVRVSGPTFARQVEHSFTVAHPLRADLTPEVDAGAGAKLWVAVNQPGLDLRSLKLAAAIRRSGGSPRWQPMNAEPGGLWSLRLPTNRGRLELSIDAQGHYLQGGDFAYRAGPLRLKLPVEEPQRLFFDDRGRPRLKAADAFPEDAAGADRKGTNGENGEHGERVPAGPLVLKSGEVEPPPLAAEREASASLPLWLAAVTLLLPLLLCGLLWYLLGRRTVALPLLPEPEAA